MKVTVFTPTYNREDLLPRLYHSIIEQTYKNIEFLIIDDGSTDNTKALIDKWKKENKVEINYFFQPNSHIHIAYNRSIERATGELFFIIDSDDYFTSPHSIETVIKEWNSIPNKEEYAGIQANCIFEDGKLVGQAFKKRDTDNFEMRYRDRIRGDKAMIYQTSVIKQFCFPEYPKEYLMESILHNRVAQKFKTRTLSKTIITKEFLDTGISKRQKDIYKELNSVIILHNELNYHPLNIQLYLWSNNRYVKHSLLQGKNIKEIKENVINKRFFLFGIAVILGKMSYKKTKRKEKKTH